VVTRFAVAGPTVLVLEDLHWADPTSLRVTLELAELAAGRPLLVLATSRPKSGREIVEQLAVSPATCRVMLRPLPADAAEALTASLISQVPGTVGGATGAGPEVLAAVLDSADGNPLFLEERLSSLLETRTLVREGGTWSLREPSGPQLPQVLERLVRSRVDRLSPAAQEAIRAAAVLGPEFTEALLAAMLGSPAAELAPVLDELCASDLVHREPPEGSAGAFRFRHALIQDATYLGLLRPERRALHARAAAALEDASRDRLPEVAAVLGRHYATAEDAERAVRYLELAGDHATDAFANYEAISSFNAALAVTRRQPGTMDADAVRLHTKLASVLWRIGRREQAGDAFRAGLRLAGAVGALQRAHLHTRLGRLELTNLHFDAAAAAFDAAEALLGDDPGGWDDATADQWLELMVDGRAAIHSMRSEPELLRAILDRARPMLEARGTPTRRHVFDRQLALEGLIRHRYRVDDAVLAGFRSSLELAEQSGEEREKDVGYATYFLSWALWLRGDLAEARERSEAALAMAGRIGETHLRSMALMMLILTAVREHDTDSLRALIPTAMAAARDDNSHTTGVLACQAWLAWQDGQPDEVIRLADQFGEFAPATMAFGARHRWVYLFPLIAARLQAGDNAAAITAARQILDPSQRLLPDELIAALEAACAAWDGGEPDAVTSALAGALDLAHDLNYF
jgi:tetratricopeptide (TPR) repeat protein